MSTYRSGLRTQVMPGGSICGMFDVVFPTELETSNADMGQYISRTGFDSLLAKTHVQHALIQPDGRHNDVPTALATLVFLDGTQDQLQAVYEAESASLGTWIPSPRSITDEENKIRFLGDVRFQRAYMSYFSMELGKFSASPKALALSHLLNGPKPLIYGLFAGLGRPLVFLSDAMELHSPILVVQALTLAAVDWVDPIYDILTHPQLALPATEFLSPEQILGRVAYDGRLSGIMKSGPGFHGVSQVFASPPVKAAVLEYVCQLDCRNTWMLVEQFSALSTLLLCGSHRASSPAFDFYLSCVPSWVNSLRVLLPSIADEADKVKLIRGVWLLIVLAYITQLRPVLDTSLLLSEELPGNFTWENVMAGFLQQGISEGKYKDLQLLRTLRSLWSLGRDCDRESQLNLRAACKIVKEWKGWTGLGADREETLNIRL